MVAGSCQEVVVCGLLKSLAIRGVLPDLSAGLALLSHLLKVPQLGLPDLNFRPALLLG